MKNFRLIFTLFLLGALLAPLGDFSHLLSDTTMYPAAGEIYYIFGVMPFWVPLMFGLATLAIGLSHLSFDRLFGSPRRAYSQRPVLVWWGVFLFVALYCLSGFLPGQRTGLADGMLAIGAFLLWYGLDRTWQGVLLGFLTAVVGTAVEMTLVHFEVFYYLPPKDILLGVARWLPWLYFAASVSVGNLARALRDQS